MEIVKSYLIVPVTIDAQNYCTTDGFEPYGFHHVYKVYENNFASMIATVKGNVSIETVESIAKLLSQDLPVVIDADYEKRLQNEIEKEQKEYVEKIKKQK